MLLSIALIAAVSRPVHAETRLKTLQIPGTPAFAAAAKDVIDVRFTLDPGMAADDGLFEDAVRVPSFSSASIAGLGARLDADLAALGAMPWRSWEIDRQIDWRWIYANAEEARRELIVERSFTHCPIRWLEPLANDFIALTTYAPSRQDLRRRLITLIPGMAAEMRQVVSAPTRRDVEIAGGVARGLEAMLRSEPRSSGRDAALAALSGYMDDLNKSKAAPEFTVIGYENYDWRLRRALLIPWSSQQLLALAQRELAEVDARLAELKPGIPTSRAPSEAQKALASGLTQKRLLELYDDIAREERAFLEKSGLMTIPAQVGPIRARPTPEAMIPLTGDGGSMNAPPMIGGANVSWWNVEHFRPEWTPEKKLEMTVDAMDYQRSDMGTYAAHEGVPGHHLQGSIARLNRDPLRKLLSDNVLVEGWALYAQSIFWESGGLGSSMEAEYETLASWRRRIRRVFYDVHIECGEWTLQEAADFKSQARRGKGTVDEDILRSINWPTQLIGYFAGKMQILELREAYRRKLGAGYTDRKFHDALLAEGMVPLVLIRAKLLGEPVPGI